MSPTRFGMGRHNAEMGCCMTILPGVSSRNKAQAWAVAAAAASAAAIAAAAAKQQQSSSRSSSSPSATCVAASVAHHAPPEAAPGTAVGAGEHGGA